MKLLITPSIALSILQQASPNRPLSEVRVKELGRLMQRGEWDDRPNTISFRDGRLIDGQHRLAAVADSGVSIMVDCIEGFWHEQKSQDGGARP